MILLNNGADSDSAHNIQQLNKIHRFKFTKAFLAFFIFLMLLGTTFWSVQWFSAMLKEFMFWDKPKNPSHYSKTEPNNAITVIDISQPIQVPKQKTLAVIQEPQESIIKAKSAISANITQNRQETIFALEPDKQRPIASLTKLMTSLIVLEEYDLKKRIKISEAAMQQEGEQGSLKLGQELSVRDLLYITLIESSNRSAFALADDIGNEYFIRLMNERAKELGMNNTNFADSTGLNSASYSTAQDLVVLSKYLYENYTLFREIISIKEFDLYLDNSVFHHKLTNTNKLLGQVEGVIGGKTGFTNDAEGCLMIIQKNLKTVDEKDYLIHVILGADDRFEQMQKLINFNI